MPNENQREQWGSKLGFVLAAAGSAIGLGNIWKFPYIAGENGGAAFVLVYLICIAVIGLPVLIGEILIGRTTSKNPVGAFKQLSGSKFWTSVGGIGVLAGFIILSFYAVVAGWSLGYIFEAISGAFHNFPEPAQSEHHFNDLVGNIYWIVGFFALFMILTMGVVLAGVQKGIELGSKILMPVLIILIIVLVIRGVTLSGAEKGIEFFLKPDWSLITGKSILLALGHAFFTLSLGMGAMLTYGSYMTKKDNVPFAAVSIILLDTVIALLAGLAIFTSVFSTGLDPSAGPGLIFHTLPVVFTKMPGGYLFAIVFFVLFSIAALTSAISLLEVITAYFIDEKKWKRKKAVIVFGGITFLLGLPSALSFNVLSDFHIFGLNFFDLADYLTANIMLPLGGLLISIFIGYRWGLDKAVANLREGAESFIDKNPLLINFWKFSIKYLAPILIFLVFLYSIGLLN